MKKYKDFEHDRSKRFGCSCYDEEVDVFTSDEEYGYSLEFIYWKQGFGTDYSLWERIRILWEFLLGQGWHKSFFDLEPDKARKFAKYILSECDRMDKVIKERENV